jgi:hypothetical protein
MLAVPEPLHQNIFASVDDATIVMPLHNIPIAVPDTPDEPSREWLPPIICMNPDVTARELPAESWSNVNRP